MSRRGSGVAALNEMHRHVAAATVGRRGGGDWSLRIYSAWGNFVYIGEFPKSRWIRSLPLAAAAAAASASGTYVR